MSNFRQRFTEWYYRKGYRMEYKVCDYGDGVAELIFRCPWWVRPMVSLFFSPSVYYHEYAMEVAKELDEGIMREIKLG